MSRDFAQLFNSVWGDRDWLALPMDGQWLYGLLLSQPTMNQAGIVPLPRQMWANCAADEDTGDRIHAALKILIDRRFVVVDDATDELLVRAFIRRDVQKGPPGAFCAAMDCAIAVCSARLRAVLYAELMRLDFPRIEAKKAGYGHRERPMEALQRALKALEPDAEPPGGRSSADSDSREHGMPHPMPYGMPDGMSEHTMPHDMPHAMGHTIGVGVVVGAVASRPSVEINSSCVSPRASAHTHAHDAGAHTRKAPTPTPPGQDPPPGRDGLEVATDSGVVDLPAWVRAKLGGPDPSSVRKAAVSATFRASTLVDAETATWPMAPKGRERGRWVHAVAELITNAIPEDAIVTGMRACAGKGYQPRSLESFVFGEANRRGPESRADRNTKAILSRITPDGGPTLAELEAAENAERAALRLRRNPEIESG